MNTITSPPSPHLSRSNRLKSHEASQICYFALISGLCLLASGAARADTLSLGDFIKQVKTGNTGTRGAADASAAQSDRQNEGDIALSPTAFATVQYAHDGKPQIVPITSYDYQNIVQYSVGISQQTSFGLLAKLSTNLYSLSYDNLNSPLAAMLGPQVTAGGSGLGAIAGSVNISNQLELSQPLLGNGFGATTRATQAATEAQALASSYGNRYTARASLVDAEAAYWRLVISRQNVALTRDNLERAQKNYEWSERRARLQLADRSDALQAQALLDVRKLDYQRAVDEEKTVSRSFNTARGIASDVVSETLASVDANSILAMSAPPRGEFRDDVKAAAQQSRAVTAQARISREREKPTLDVFGTLGLNGQNTNFGNSYKQSVTMDHPTAIVGLKLTAPLSLGTAAAARSAYSREEAAADLTYQRKVFEQDRTWADLTDRLGQAKKRLQLAATLEKTQQEKLFHERERYRTGRTTAFQVLSFETDFAQSQLSRILSESDVLGILTQMKLYGEEL